MFYSRVLWSGAIAIAALVGCSQSEGSGNAPSCAQNSDCKEGLVCALGRCRMPCKESRDCGEGGSCITDGVSAICQPLEERNTPCDVQTDCFKPLACATDYRCRNLCYTDNDCNVLGITGRACALDMSGVRHCAEPPEVINGLLVATPPPGAKGPYTPWDAAALAPVDNADAAVPGAGKSDGAVKTDAATASTDSGVPGGKATPFEVVPRIPIPSFADSPWAPAALALDSMGRPIVIARGSSAQGYGAVAMKLEQGDAMFSPVGGPIGSKALWSNPSLRVDASNVPWVAMQQLNFDEGATELALRRFDGTNWKDVAPAIPLTNTNTGYRMRYLTQLEFDPEGHPVVLVCAEYSSPPQIFRENMGAWETLGPVTTPGLPTECSLAISPSGEMFLAMKFDATFEVWRRAAGSWIAMSTLGTSSFAFPRGLRLIWFEDNLVAAWNDNTVVHVARFDGTTWTELPFTPANPVQVSLELEIANGVLTLVLQELHLGTAKADVYYYRNGAWERDTAPVAPTDTGGLLDIYSLASRAGYTYLSYYAAEKAGIVRLAAP